MTSVQFDDAGLLPELFAPLLHLCVTSGHRRRHRLCCPLVVDDSAVFLNPTPGHTHPSRIWVGPVHIPRPPSVAGVGRGPERGTLANGTLFWSGVLAPCWLTMFRRFRVNFSFLFFRHFYALLFRWFFTVSGQSYVTPLRPSLIHIWGTYAAPVVDVSQWQSKLKWQQSALVMEKSKRRLSMETTPDRDEMRTTCSPLNNSSSASDANLSGALCVLSNPEVLRATGRSWLIRLSRDMRSWRLIPLLLPSILPLALTRSMLSLLTDCFTIYSQREATRTVWETQQCV